MFELFQDHLQLLLPVGGQLQQLQQLRHVRRDIIPVRQQANDLVFHGLTPGVQTELSSSSIPGLVKAMRRVL